MQQVSGGDAKSPSSAIASGDVDAGRPELPDN
jgi:hypothetical protein